jgi:hypothetical protein
MHSLPKSQNFYSHLPSASFNSHLKILFFPYSCGPFCYCGQNHTLGRSNATHQNAATACAEALCSALIIIIMLIINIVIDQSTMLVPGQLYQVTKLTMSQPGRFFEATNLQCRFKTVPLISLCSTCQREKV